MREESGCLAPWNRHSERTLRQYSFDIVGWFVCAFCVCVLNFESIDWTMGHGEGHSERLGRKGMPAIADTDNQCEPSVATV
jgi:hypothetical protein